MIVDVSNIRVLFLGNCADPNMVPSDDPEIKAKRRYQSEIYAVLSELCKEVIGSDDPEDLFKRKGEYDFVFSLYNRMGFRSCEVFISSICEYLRVPYLGSYPEIRGIAENKKLFKFVVDSFGIPAPQSAAFYRNEKIIKPDNLTPPYFVKPMKGANSEWVDDNSYCLDWDSAAKQIEFLHSNGIAVLVEEFAEGINLTVPVLGGSEPKMLGVVEVFTEQAHGLRTFQEKLQEYSDLSYKLCNKQIVLDAIEKHALLIHEALKPLDYFQIDYRYNPSNDQLFILEINICCHIASFGSFGFAAQKSGISHKNLVRTILQTSMERQGLIS